MLLSPYSLLLFAYVFVWWLRWTIFTAVQSLWCYSKGTALHMWVVTLGMRMIFVGLSLTVSFPDVSVKLSSFVGIMHSCSPPLLVRWFLYCFQQYPVHKFFHNWPPKIENAFLEIFFFLIPVLELFFDCSKALSSCFFLCFSLIN